jgi:hypothetical protein
VIVNHVEDNLDPFRMKLHYHRLEFLHRRFHTTGGVTRIRCQKAKGVVAPVIGAAALEQKRLINVVMHRQQFDRSHTQFAQVLERGR